MTDNIEVVERKKRGERLREARGSISRKEFAQRTGLGESSIGNWERGDRDADATTLHIYRVHTGVDLNWLICGDSTHEYPDRQRALDHELMSNIIVATDEWLIRSFLDLHSIHKARLYSLLYDEFISLSEVQISIQEIGAKMSTLLPSIQLDGELPNE